MIEKEALIPQVGRVVPLEQLKRIRASVASGVESVVKPFVKRLKEQSRIPNRKRRYQSAA